jgi:hypothetical protein
MYYRGPFSGGKVIQAHMCGRLPHDTLVVGLEPDVPPALISTDVEFWFRCVWLRAQGLDR